MKRYGNIYEKIASVENLKEAHRMARADKKFYREVKMVDSDPEPYLGIIRKMLLDESYVVSPYRISHINDRGKEREIAKLPYFPDRINRYYFDKIKGGNTNHARQWKGLRWKGMGCSDSCA